MTSLEQSRRNPTQDTVSSALPGLARGELCSQHSSETKLLSDPEKSLTSHRLHPSSSLSEVVGDIKQELEESEQTLLPGFAVAWHQIKRAIAASIRQHGRTMFIALPCKAFLQGRRMQVSCPSVEATTTLAETATRESQTRNCSHNAPPAMAEISAGDLPTTILTSLAVGVRCHCYVWLGVGN